MADINRKPSAGSLHEMHRHRCPSCRRTYTCNCNNQRDGRDMVCIDCETGTYNPVIHGGEGTKEQA